MMTLKEIMTQPIAPLTLDELNFVSTPETNIRSVIRSFEEGQKPCYIMVAGDFRLMDDDDNKNYNEVDDDGDPTDPDDEGFFPLYLEYIMTTEHGTTEHTFTVNAEKFLEVARPLYNQNKLASFVQRRKA